jgi:hypothetical protein
MQNSKLKTFSILSFGFTFCALSFAFIYGCSKVPVELATNYYGAVDFKSTGLTASGVSAANTAYVNGESNYALTPTGFKGELMKIDFTGPYEPGEAPSPTDEYNHHWRLRGMQGSRQIRVAKGTVSFNLTTTQRVATDTESPPDKAGTYCFLGMNSVYWDLDFKFGYPTEETYSARIYFDNYEVSDGGNHSRVGNAGAQKGDLLLKDSDGAYKWIAIGSGEALSATRPANPVIDDQLATSEAGDHWWDPLATSRELNADIEPDMVLTTTQGRFIVTLDFGITNCLRLNSIDASSFTKEKLLESIDAYGICGNLTLVPTVEEQPLE